MRGKTRLPMPTKDNPDNVIGGGIREEEGFDGSGKRRAHAQKVWEATVQR
ncbi:MAG: hypothetical protein ABEN55_08305 [Bradymonadaceae bacterium]